MLVAPVRLSRDGEVRTEFDRGMGILDGLGMPLGLFERVSSMLIAPSFLSLFAVQYEAEGCFQETS